MHLSYIKSAQSVRIAHSVFKAAADNRTEIISPANEQYKGRGAAVPIALRAFQKPAAVPITLRAFPIVQ